MGTNEYSQPASKSSWDSQDFGDVNMVVKRAHFHKSSRPQWVKCRGGDNAHWISKNKMAATAVQWELCGTNFRQNIANLWVSCHNGNNDRSARVLFVQHPREQGEYARVLTAHSPCSLGCWTNNTLAARTLSPNHVFLKLIATCILWVIYMKEAYCSNEREGSLLFECIGYDCTGYMGYMDFTVRFWERLL